MAIERERKGGRGEKREGEKEEHGRRWRLWTCEGQSELRDRLLEGYALVRIFPLPLNRSSSSLPPCAAPPGNASAPALVLPMSVVPFYPVLLCRLL
jgi:hypothetical protein